jgi:ribosome-associated protein
VVGLDVREISSFADTFIIATGTSDRHVRSVADSIEAALKAHGEPPMGIEGYDEGRWVLVDCSDTIVHIFQSEIREHYDLERLWSDAPVLELEVAARSVGT